MTVSMIPPRRASSSASTSIVLSPLDENRLCPVYFECRNLSKASRGVEPLEYVLLSSSVSPRLPLLDALLIQLFARGRDVLTRRPPSSVRVAQGVESSGATALRGPADVVRNSGRGPTTVRPW